MDIKEIREWAKDLSNYHFETRVSDLNDTARLFNNLKAAVPFLLSEVEGLQNTIAQMQYAEQMIYECRMKGGDTVRHLLDNLLAENKQLKAEVERLEEENAALREVVEVARDFSKEMHGVKVLIKEHPDYLEKCFRLIKALEGIKEDRGEN